jgi:WD40 repeat protein
VTSVNPATQLEEVEVAHEALIRYWPRLRAWLDEDRVFLRLRDGIREAALEWEAGKRDNNLLIHRGSRLEDAEALARIPRFALNVLEKEYLDTCVAHRQAVILADERRRRRILAVSLLVTLIMAFVALFAWSQWRSAIKSAHVASTAQNVAMQNANTATFALGFAQINADNALTQAAAAVAARQTSDANVYIAQTEAANAATQGANAAYQAGTATNALGISDQQRATAEAAKGTSQANANSALSAQQTSQANAIIAQTQAANAANQAATATRALATATIAKGQAEQQATNAAYALATATKAQGEAEIQATNAAYNLATATIAQGDAEQKAITAKANELAGLALQFFDQGNLDLAYLLGVQALSMDDNNSTRSAMWSLMQYSPDLRSVLPLGDDFKGLSIGPLAVSDDGVLVAAGLTGTNLLKVWNVKDHTLALDADIGSWATGIAFGPKGLMAVSLASGGISVYRCTDKVCKHVFYEQPEYTTAYTYGAVAISPDGWVAVGTDIKEDYPNPLETNNIFLYDCSLMDPITNTTKCIQIKYITTNSDKPIKLAFDGSGYLLAVIEQWQPPVNPGVNVYRFSDCNAQHNYACTGDMQNPYYTYSSTVTSLAFGSGGHVAIGFQNGSMVVGSLDSTLPSIPQVTFLNPILGISYIKDNTSDSQVIITTTGGMYQTGCSQVSLQWQCSPNYQSLLEYPLQNFSFSKGCVMAAGTGNEIQFWTRPEPNCIQDGKILVDVKNILKVSTMYPGMLIGDVMDLAFLPRGLLIAGTQYANTSLTGELITWQCYGTDCVTGPGNPFSFSGPVLTLGTNGVDLLAAGIGYSRINTTGDNQMLLFSCKNGQCAGPGVELPSDPSWNWSNLYGMQTSMSRDNMIVYGMGEANDRSPLVVWDKCTDNGCTSGPWIKYKQDPFPYSSGDLAFGLNNILAFVTGDNTIIGIYNCLSNPLGCNRSLDLQANGRVYSLVFASDGRLAAGTEKGLQVWNCAQTGCPLIKTYNTSSRVVALDLGPNNTVAFGTLDGQVQIVDYQIGAFLAGTLPGMYSSINSIKYNLDKTALAFGSGGEVVIWDTSLILQDWKDKACQIASRNLTQAEWNLYLPKYKYALTCP